MERPAQSALGDESAPAQLPRSTFATITPNGRSLVRKTRRSNHGWLQRLFGDRLDDHDVAEVTRIMDLLDPGTPSSAS